MCFTTLFSQNKNYSVNSNNIIVKKTKSEFTTLKITKNAPKGALKAVPLLASLVEKAPEYIAKIIANNKKKYVAEYSAKNTVDFITNTNALPSLTIERYINTTDNKTELATKIELEPKIVHGQFLAFYINKASLQYSKAKLKKNYNHIILLIEVTATYATLQEDKTLKKTEVTSSPLKLTLDIASGKSINPNFKVNLSDVFSTDNILSFSVKIIETNPYKIKLEKIEDFTNDFKEPISDFFTKLSEVIKD